MLKMVGVGRMRMEIIEFKIVNRNHLYVLSVVKVRGIKTRTAKATEEIILRIRVLGDRISIKTRAIRMRIKF